MPNIAIHLHLHYVEQLDDILRLLHFLDGTQYDLFVTVTERNDAVKQQILAFKPEAKILLVPNLGYDIGPFIDFLHRINLDSYDYILKIHTKRRQNNHYCLFDGRRFTMKTWGDMLFDALLHSSQAFRHNLKIMADNPDVGMLGSSFVLTADEISYSNVLERGELEMSNLGLQIPSDKHFIAGTMFLVRTKLLTPFLHYKISDFSSAESNIHDDTLAHVLERMFGWAVTAQGYQIRGVQYKSFFLECFLASLYRFLYQKKNTRNGKLIVKICKIPVYYGKVAR
ncbi:MAG: hypothetical protein ILA52_00015 [Alphaproteobacteria bacterium]|nr:hypothetical protein [Alphaproteobacteria bacterium]